jgi:hypothetical protein
MSNSTGALIWMSAVVALMAFAVGVNRWRHAPLARPDYSEINVRLWCSVSHLEVRALKRCAELDGGTRVGFRIQIEDEDGRRRKGWVVSDRDQLDRELARLNFRWDAWRAADHLPSTPMDNPLWDDAQDGGPGA